MTRATLADVAARAGVSGKTVSRVVNRDANVSEATRARVDSAIAALGFRPNLAARSLAASRSFLIGTLAVNLSSFYYSALYRGAARGCRANGYHLVVEEFAADEAIAAVYDRDLRATGYDGLILPPPLCDDRALLAALDRDGVRYVRIAPATEVERSPSVFADDEAGVAALVDHLWALGHRRFGIVTGPGGHAATTLRDHGYRRAIARNGGDAGAIATAAIAPNETVVASGRHAARTLLDRADPPTAIFAFNDEIAAGVMGIAHERGLRVPEDLAIAGFDDSEAATLTWPPITTIRQPIADMAHAAVEMLVAPRGDVAERRCCPVELVIRQSTKP